MTPRGRPKDEWGDPKRKPRGAERIAGRGRDDRARGSGRDERFRRGREAPPVSDDRDLSKSGWGGVARKGVRVLDEPNEGATASSMFRGAIDRARATESADSPRAPFEPEVWIREDDEPAPHSAEPRRSSRRRAPVAKVGDEAVKELASEVGEKRAERQHDRLAQAVRAYERDRYGEALKILRELAERAPGAAAVRELHGLTLYRMGRWSDAAKELEAFRAMSNSHDQHPVLADCYRALKRWKKVDEVWAELREASPSADLVTEGRIVVAGSLADQGRIKEAVALLEKTSGRAARAPKLHHLRQWYALADLYERSGETPKARTLFRRIADVDRDFVDVLDRLRTLS